MSIGYDLNAKSKIGADIPLMQNSNVFILEEKINPKKLESVLRENGFLNKIRTSGLQFFDRIDRQNLKLFYTSFTEECKIKLDDYSLQQKLNIVQFLCNAAKEFGLESLVLPVIYDMNEIISDVSKSGLQLIPSLYMKAKSINEFKNQIEKCIEAGCFKVPIIAFQFARYPNANLGSL